MDVTFRQERSINGFPLDLLKSGLQKYIRRNEEAKGLWCLVELDLFNTDTNPNHIAAVKRIRTNVLNRLAITMTEDINLAAPGLPEIMYGLYTKIKSEQPQNTRKLLVEMYTILVRQKKVRFISHIGAVFLLKTKTSITKEHLEIHKDIIKSFEKEHSELSELNIHKYEVADITEAYNRLISSVKKRKIKAFVWLHWFLRLDGKLQDIWKFVLSFGNASVQALYKFWQEIKSQERNIFLYHALLVMIFPRKRKKDYSVEIDDEFVEKMYKINLSKKEIQFNPYVYDRHVRGGNKSMKYFAEVGAHVVNEDTEVMVPVFKEIYIVNSIEKDYLETNTLLKKFVDITFIDKFQEAFIVQFPHAQLLTSSHKKPVFVIGANVVKGPYAMNDKKLWKNLYNTRAMGLLEDTLDLPENMRSTLPWKKVLKTRNNTCYLVAKNVGKTKDITWGRYSSKIETKVKIIGRNNHIYRLSDNFQGIYSDIIIAGLQHLYLRYILGVGDSGFHNVLFRMDGNPRRIAGIDLEESRGAIKHPGKIALLFSKLNKKVKSYGKYLNQIKTLEPEQVNSLQLLGINLDEVLSRIHTYAQTNFF